MGAEFEAEAEPRVSTIPRTTPAITSTATAPARSQVRGIDARAGAPAERTGGGVRRGGGPSPAFFLADRFAIGARW